MSCPTAVRSCPIDAPLCSVARDASFGGTRSMYCSPTADTLLTVAVTLSGTGVLLLSRILAMTPSSVSPTESTRPIVTPR